MQTWMLIAAISPVALWFGLSLYLSRTNRELDRLSAELDSVRKELGEGA